MGTTAAVVTVGLTGLVLALVASLAVRARSRSDEVTQAALRRIGDGVDALSSGLGAVVERAQSEGAALGRSVGITLDLDEALANAAAAAAALPGMEAGAARVERHDGTPAQRSVGITSGSTGLEGGLDPPDRTAWESALVEWRRGPATWAEEPLRIGVVVPLVHAGARIGVIGAYARTAGRAEEAAIVELRELADAAAPAIAAARDHEAVKELVRTDPLTGLLNRRGFDEALTREIARADRASSPLSLLMIDLDDFREVNKESHTHGDDVLRALGEALLDACRATDIVCRRGGEEFSVILPDTPCLEAIRLDARIRALVATTAFPHVDRLRFSSGITALSENDDAVSIDTRASELVNVAKLSPGKDRLHHDCDLATGARLAMPGDAPADRRRSARPETPPTTL